jgi:O-antigen ligase
VAPLIGRHRRRTTEHHGDELAPHELAKPYRLATAGETIFDAARDWRDQCLIGGKSLLWQDREVWSATLNMARERPGMGFGLGTWLTAYPRYALFDPGLAINQAHNDWLQWTVEGGIPFLLLMLVVALLLARKALRSIWGLGVIFVFVHALVDYPFQQRPVLAALFFAVAGAVASMDQHA